MAIVIKLGTQVLVDEQGLAESRLLPIVSEAAELIKSGKRVVIVSSGAVGLGRMELKLAGTLELPQKQACAAVGQSALMELYRRLFSKHHISVSQILVTAHDFSNRERYLNLKNTFECLLDMGVVPIVNENDVVSVAGIVEDGSSKSFDDNDKLSALVTGKLGAERLIILTNVEGVFDSNPQKNKEAKLIREITSFSQLSSIDSSGQSTLGRGGMSSKLKAAKIASLCGVKTTISSGLKDNAIMSALSQDSGTTITPKQSLSEKRRWIGAASGYSAVVKINKCATEVLLKEGASLLPVGVISLVGTFEAQEVVSIQDENGEEVGRGLTSMSSGTLEKVKGLKSSDAKMHLAAGEKDEVIHRNNLVIFFEL